MTAGHTPDRAAAQAAKAALADRLCDDARVVGIGIGTGEDGYVVEVRLREPDAESAVPPSVSDVPVRTRVVGPIEPR